MSDTSSSGGGFSTSSGSGSGSSQSTSQGGSAYIANPVSDLNMLFAQLDAGLMSTMYNWAQGQFNSLVSLTDPIINNYLDASQKFLDAANWSLDRFQNTFVPQENALIQQANTWASAPREALNMGMAQADEQRAADAARLASETNLRDFGIDPSSGRYAELEQIGRGQAGAAAAGIGEQAYLATVDEANKLRQAAIAEGANYPGWAVNFGNAGLSGLAGAATTAIQRLQTGANALSDSAAFKPPPLQAPIGPFNKSQSTSQQKSQNQSQSKQNPKQQQQQQPKQNDQSGGGTRGPFNPMFPPNKNGIGNQDNGPPIQSPTPYDFSQDPAAWGAIDPQGIYSGMPYSPYNYVQGENQPSYNPLDPNAAPGEFNAPAPPGWDNATPSAPDPSVYGPTNPSGNQDITQGPFGFQPNNQSGGDPFQQAYPDPSAGTGTPGMYNPVDPNQYVNVDPTTGYPPGQDPYTGTPGYGSDTWGGQPTSPQSSNALSGPDPNSFQPPTSPDFQGTSQDWSGQAIQTDPWNSGYNTDPFASQPTDTSGQSPYVDNTPTVDNTFDPSAGMPTDTSVPQADPNTYVGDNTFDPNASTSTDTSGGGGGYDMSSYSDPSAGYSGDSGGDYSFARGGRVSQDAIPPPSTGGHVNRNLSPSHGSRTDDIPARLNAGEYVIPRDVAAFKGREFFDKLIAKSRQTLGGPAGPRPQPKMGAPLGGPPRFRSRGM